MNIHNSLTENNLSYFISQSFSTISPGVAYAENWHIDLIASKLKQVEEGKIKRLIINLPPRYLKSICISVAWSAWLLGNDPKTKIMAASYSQKLSTKHSLDCRLILQSNWFKNVFPECIIAKGENQKFKFVTTKRGYRFATSTGGTATGEGGDFLIVDDPQNPNKINSKKYREDTIEWFEQTFMSRLNDKKNGGIVIVMQRLHEEDLCGHLLNKDNSQWDLLKIPVIFENSFSYEEHFANRTRIINIKPKTALHEIREDISALNQLKTDIGEYAFASQYLQNPTPSTGNMIKKNWLKYFHTKENLYFPQIIQTWDTAIKAKDENDYTVGITIGIKDYNYYLLDIVRFKLEFPELLTSVENFAQKWSPQAILIEDSASGQSLIQTLKTRLKTAIVAIKPKFDKITRFAKHCVLFEAGKIFIKHDSNWRTNFENELLNFPKSKNDDQIDSLSQGLNYLEEKSQSIIRKI